jgi:hypothetical protein
MANITLSIPDDVHTEMKRFSEVRWSEVARKAIIDKVQMLKMTEKIASKTKLTQKDIDEVSQKIKAAVTKRLMDEYNFGH